MTTDPEENTVGAESSALRRELAAVADAAESSRDAEPGPRWRSASPPVSTLAVQRLTEVAWDVYDAHQTRRPQQYGFDRALSAGLSALASDPAVREALAKVVHETVLPGCTHDEHGADCFGVVSAVLSALDPGEPR